MDKKYLLMKYVVDMGKLKILSSERFSVMPRIKPNQAYRNDLQLLERTGILYVDGNMYIALIIDLDKYSPNGEVMKTFEECSNLYDMKEKESIVLLMTEHSRQHKLHNLLSNEIQKG